MELTKEIIVTVSKCSPRLETTFEYKRKGLGNSLYFTVWPDKPTLPPSFFEKTEKIRVPVDCCPKICIATGFIDGIYPLMFQFQDYRILDGFIFHITPQDIAEMALLLFLPRYFVQDQKPSLEIFDFNEIAFLKYPNENPLQLQPICDQKSLSNSNRKIIPVKCNPTDELDSKFYTRIPKGIPYLFEYFTTDFELINRLGVEYLVWDNINYVVLYSDDLSDDVKQIFIQKHGKIQLKNPDSEYDCRIQYRSAEYFVYKYNGFYIPKKFPYQKALEFLFGEDNFTLTGQTLVLRNPLSATRLEIIKELTSIINVKSDMVFEIKCD